MADKNIHEGHRQRLREKYLRSQGNDLEDHELLELLLFYSIPVRNTNDIAHILLQRFGSVRGVFDADIKELEKVENLGGKSALFIKIVGSCMSRYGLSGMDMRKPFTTFKQISEYLEGLYIGEANETVYMLLFNNSMRLIKTDKLCTGSVNDVAPNVRAIVETSYHYKASYVILAHNHPGGIAVPSGSDIEMTYRLNQALECVGINFIDHFVVAGNRCSPILHGPYGDRTNGHESNATGELNVAKSKLEEDLEKLFGKDKNS